MFDFSAYPIRLFKTNILLSYAQKRILVIFRAVILPVLKFNCSVSRIDRIQNVELFVHSAPSSSKLYRVVHTSILAYSYRSIEQ